MSVADVGSGVPFGSMQGIFPLRFLTHQEDSVSDSDADATNSFGGIVVITAIDAVATGNPTGSEQCYFTCAVLGHADFFYDSQTIGEAGGVHWHWRGQMVLQVGDTLHTHLTADPAVDYWSVVANGLAGPFPIV